MRETQSVSFGRLVSFKFVGSYKHSSIPLPLAGYLALRQDKQLLFDALTLSCLNQEQ